MMHTLSMNIARDIFYSFSFLVLMIGSAIFIDNMIGSAVVHYSISTVFFFLNKKSCVTTPFLFYLWHLYFSFFKSANIGVYIYAWNALVVHRSLGTYISKVALMDLLFCSSHMLGLALSFCFLTTNHLDVWGSKDPK